MEICYCGLVKQSKAGTDLRDGVTYCKNCGRPTEVPRSVLSVPLTPTSAPISEPGIAGPSRVTRPATALSPVDLAARQADAAASVLDLAAGILLALSLLGSLVLFLVGLTEADAALIGAAIAGALLWLLIWAAARAVAARLRLAAAVARSHGK